MSDTFRRRPFLVVTGTPTLFPSSAVLLFTGTAVAGLGFGPAFAGSFRTLAPLAPPATRAGLLAAVYLAFAVPAVLAGLAATRWGLRGSASGYAVAVAGPALAAAALTALRPPDPPSAR